MAENLKIGDRVKVYGNSEYGQEISGSIGVVRVYDVHALAGWVTVEINNKCYEVHKNQCRRLKKKLSGWITKEWLQSERGSDAPIAKRNWIFVKEVKHDPTGNKK